MRRLQKVVHSSYLGRSGASQTARGPQENLLLSGTADYQAQRV
jgi:hypothetical protein